MPCSKRTSAPSPARKPRSSSTTTRPPSCWRSTRSPPSATCWSRAARWSRSAALAANPLRRALRPGKLTLAALGATLRLYRETPDLPAALPVLRWLTRPLAELEAVGCAAAPALARRLGQGYRVTLVPSECEVGSGAVPAVALASRALAVEHPEVGAERIAARFRAARPPVLGRIHDGRFLLDLRGIFDAAELAVDL